MASETLTGLKVAILVTDGFEQVGKRIMPGAAGVILLEATRREYARIRPGGAVDGAVHAAAPQQRGVGGVDYGVDLACGDVSLHHLDAVH